MTGMEADLVWLAENKPESLLDHPYNLSLSLTDGMWLCYVGLALAQNSNPAEAVAGVRRQVEMGEHFWHDDPRKAEASAKAVQP